MRKDRKRWARNALHPNRSSKIINVHTIGPILFEHSKRAKNISISVKTQQRVRVAVPTGISFRSAEKTVRGKYDWIRKKQLAVSQQEQRFVNLPPIPVATAKLVLTNRILLLTKKYGFTVNRITIRNQRTRWGSCSIKSNISLNIKLYYLPADLRDYVILHELVHTVHHNHSPAFWDTLKTILPTAKSLDRRLKKHGLPVD